MTRTTIIDPLIDSGWDAFVERHPYGWLYHLSGWKKILENTFKHMTGYYVVRLDSNDEIQAALPLFHVKSWLTGSRLVSVPYASFFDPLISSAEDIDELLKSAIGLSKELKASYVEIRTLTASGLVQDESLGVQRHFKHHYIRLDAGLEKVLRSFDRTCVRQKIRRAEKNNLHARVAESTKDLEDFYRLYSITRKQNGLPPLPYRFIKTILDVFSPSKKAFLMIAEHKERLVAGLILFRYKNRMSAEYAASDKNALSLGPNHLLFWEAIKMASREGLEIFDFGRTSQGNSGLMNFKKRWGTEVCDLPSFYYPKEAVEGGRAREESRGYRIVGKICRNAPNFVLPHIGNFCYRHMG
jgi:FemAB-related protein (PEP-CTERM system-associated)